MMNHSETLLLTFIKKFMLNEHTLHETWCVPVLIKPTKCPANLNHRPHFSVISCTYNSSEYALHKCIPF